MERGRFVFWRTIIRPPFRSEWRDRGGLVAIWRPQIVAAGRVRGMAAAKSGRIRGVADGEGGCIGKCKFNENICSQ